MRRRAALVAVAVAVAVFVVLDVVSHPLAALAGEPPAPAAALDPGGTEVVYGPPVDAPVTDHFRPPSERWGEGNRGLEYATEPGTPVLAAADGEVVFAGDVAGSLHVTVLHADGLRTTYSFLQSIAVVTGARVAKGDPVGTSGDRLHFGVRHGDDYLDPALLFDSGVVEVWLVPEERRSPRPPGAERAAIAGMLSTLPPRPAAGAGVSRRVASAIAGRVVRKVGARLDEVRGAVHYAIEVGPHSEPGRLGRTITRWLEQRGNCTAAEVTPPRPAGRRRVVLVGGLGSSSENAAVFGVRTGELGYAPADVVRFSYRGGTTHDNPYRPDDTEADIRRSGRRLRSLLERLQAQEPGVPVDVIAHSQGGLVTRSALAEEIDPGDPRLAPLGHVITLGSPHTGADIATALAMTGHTAAGGRLQKVTRLLLPDQIDPTATSVRQMAETSEFLRRLNRRPLPPGLHFTSIGARDDLVVPAGHTRVRGAGNVTVTVPGAARDHDGLPRSPAATREMALALAGLPPTCQAFADSMVDSLVSDRIAQAEDAVGAALWWKGRGSRRTSTTTKGD